MPDFIYHHVFSHTTLGLNKKSQTVPQQNNFCRKSTVQFLWIKHTDLKLQFLPACSSDFWVVLTRSYLEANPSQRKTCECFTLKSPSYPQACFVTVEKDTESSFQRNVLHIKTFIQEKHLLVNEEFLLFTILATYFYKNKPFL